MVINKQPILLIGASGNVGIELAQHLSDRGWTLRLTDRRPYPQPLPHGATFFEADLADASTISRLVDGCYAIVHFGAYVGYGSFDDVLDPSIRGTYNVFDAARRFNSRVVYASSNHVVGFHDTGEMLDANCALRPDSFYALAKIYGEMLARLYWDKHGVDSAVLRIGSCFAEPRSARELSTWLSFADCCRLVHCALTAPKLGCSVIWGASANVHSYWRRDDRALIGWAPQDSADEYADKFSDTTVESQARYQGGRFCQYEFSRRDHGVVSRVE